MNGRYDYIARLFDGVDVFLYAPHGLSRELG
jgi:hypothetical protein